MSGKADATDHVWYYIEESLIGTEKEKGPFDETQLMSLVKRARFHLTTRVRSPTRTNNEWIQAGNVLKLALMINQAEIEAADSKKVSEAGQQTDT